MRNLTKPQLMKMDKWMQDNARPYDLAKWNYLFNGGCKDAIVEEMLKYQNADGGMGSGFEADVVWVAALKQTCYVPCLRLSQRQKLYSKPTNTDLTLIPNG